MSERIKSEECLESHNKKHYLREPTNDDGDAYFVCARCGAKFYLVHEKVFKELNVTPEARRGTVD